MVLTDKQRKDLHDAMYNYMFNRKDIFKETLIAFEKEANIIVKNKENYNINNNNILEKKWNSVVRLQSRILELENTLQLIKEQNKVTGIISRRDVINNNNNNNNINNNNNELNGSLLISSSPEYILQGHRSSITDVIFHPLYSILASSSEDSTIKIWDYETGELEKSLKGHTNTVLSICFNINGELLASSSSDLTIKIWDFKIDTNTKQTSYNCIKTLRGHEHMISCVRFINKKNNNINNILSCSRDQTIRLWDIDTGLCIQTINGHHTNWIRDLIVHNDENNDDNLSLFATCGNDQKIIIWDLNNLINNNNNISNNIITVISNAHEHVIEKIKFPTNLNTHKTLDKIYSYKKIKNANNINEINPTKYILSCSRDRSIKLWNALEGQLFMTFLGHDSWVRSIGFHPNGKYILSVGEDKMIKAFDLINGRCIKTIEQAHHHFITCLAIHPSISICLTGGMDKNIHIWNCK